MTAELVIERRFRGPARSANGGYTAGRLAGVLHDQSGGPVTVTLRRPPPLEVPLRLRVGRGSAALLDGETEVAVSEPAEPAEPTEPADAAPPGPEPVSPVGWDEAGRAELGYAGLTSHPFPECFTCGTARAPGDGLRLAPGRLADGRTACRWTPDPSLDDGDGRVLPEFCWAALDCPGGWTADLEGRPMVLGRMTAVVDRRPLVGEPHVVMGRLLGHEGRKTFTATTVYDSSGSPVARAGHVWVVVDPGTFS